MKPDEGLFQTIMTAIERQKQSEQWIRDNGQYIPMPSTWLNQRRWNDEMEITTQPRAAPDSTQKRREPVQAEQPKSVKWSDFDADDAFKAALRRTYGRS